MSKDLTPNYKEVGNYIENSQLELRKMLKDLNQLRFNINDPEEFDSAYRSLEKRLKGFFPYDTQKKAIYRIMGYLQKFKKVPNLIGNLENTTEEGLKPYLNFIMKYVWGSVTKHNLTMTNEDVEIEGNEKRMNLHLNYKQYHRTFIQLRNKKKKGLQIRVDPLLGHDTFEGYTNFESLAQKFHDSLLNSDSERRQNLKQQLKLIFSLPDTIDEYLNARNREWKDLLEEDEF